MVVLDADDYIAHYGLLRRSGRYPWGSGKDPLQRSKSFLETLQGLIAKFGWTTAEVAEYYSTEEYPLSSVDIRAMKTIARHQVRAADIAMAQRLSRKGMSNKEAAARMGIPEPTYRSLLAPGVKEKNDILTTTANMLKGEVANNTYVDVGSGVENHLGMSRTKLATAVAMLKEEGYVVHTIKVPQQTTGKDTAVKVLAPPGTTWGDVSKNRDQIRMPQSFSDDGGRTLMPLGLKEPKQINPNRLQVIYKEDGGAEMDGVIFVRPGVDDISLDGASYAQVRVMIGEGHYAKGMAIYKTDLPDGVDLAFNTNKSKADVPKKLDALKEVEKDFEGNVDPKNPFQSELKRQIYAKDSEGNVILDSNGQPKELSSAMNIVNEEGDWSTWSSNLSTQMLSKQSPKLAQEQLDVTYERALKDLEEIKKLSNPVVRKRLLEEFADSTDASAVHMQAAKLSARQSTHVLMPVGSLKEGEIYAPNFRNGEQVVLIRHPHGGTFEIPELTVNNRNQESKKLLKGARDAVGINAKVAERLSGADFDGDTVLVIPNNDRKVETTPALKELEGFDPREDYKAYEGMPRMKKRTKQLQMGDVSNLITDMSLHGAPQSELARAVKHSMVVIDAEKHHLNYKQSARDHGIPALKEKYQERKNAGASTLISRATSTERVAEYKPRPYGEGGPVNKKTGELEYVPTGRKVKNRKGETVDKTVEVTKLGNTKDAFTLVSGKTGTPMERVYATHSNKMKALANRTRLEVLNTPSQKYSKSAKTTYQKQVDELNAALDLAKRNAPLERRAQVVAKTIVDAKRRANPDMDNDTLKKTKNLAIREARARTGAGKNRITITPTQWEAIQAGAISGTKLGDILNNADMDVVKKLATPKQPTLMSSAKSKRAATMLASGHTRAEVAKALGVSLSTLDADLYGS